MAAPSPISESPVQVMITGDYLKTAIAIAKNVQILQPQDDEAEAVGKKLGIQLDSTKKNLGRIPRKNQLNY